MRRGACPDAMTRAAFEYVDNVERKVGALAELDAEDKRSPSLVQKSGQGPDSGDFVPLGGRLDAHTGETLRL